MAVSTTILGGRPEENRHDRPAADNYVPLKERFLAWWNGDDEEYRSTDDARSRIVPADSGGDPEPLWGAARLEAIEKVWGPGFLLPGGDQFARKLFAGLALSSKKSVLDLNADLGGTARALSTQHNLWMDAFEPNDRLAVEGQRRSLAAGLGKRVPITRVDYDTVELVARRYDAIYSRERLHAIANKARLLDECVKGLKDHGQIVLTDYVLPEPETASTTGPLLRRDGEPSYFWTLSRYRLELQRRGLRIYLAQEMTEEYLRHIHTAWSKAPDTIRRERMNRVQVDMIMDEGAVWLARWKALRNQEIQFARIHAQKDRAD